MRYKHKVDWWIRLILVSTVLMYLPILFLISKDEQFIIILSMFITGLIIFPFLIGYIELDDEYIVIKLHIFKQKIPYDNIKSIRLCTNMLSSMAMTTKRIEIKVYNKGFIRGTTYIGPQNREEVYEELKRRCFNVEK